MSNDLPTHPIFLQSRKTAEEGFVVELRPSARLMMDNMLAYAVSKFPPTMWTDSLDEKECTMEVVSQRMFLPTFLHLLEEHLEITSGKGATLRESMLEVWAIHTLKTLLIVRDQQKLPPLVNIGRPKLYVNIDCHGDVGTLSGREKFGWSVQMDMNLFYPRTNTTTQMVPVEVVESRPMEDTPKETK